MKVSHNSSRIQLSVIFESSFLEHSNQLKNFPHGIVKRLLPCDLRVSVEVKLMVSTFLYPYSFMLVVVGDLDLSIELGVVVIHESP